MKRIARVVAVLLVVGMATSAHAFDHGPFDAILRAHVSPDGKVDYAAIAARAKPQLAAYLERVAKAEIGSLPRNEQLAFYLNAYNAHVINQVVMRWPQLSKVTAVPGFFDALRHRVAGRSLTLNALEKGVILKRFRDPRVHFALVCGARSCPPLRNRAFSGSGLGATLDGLARRFVNSPLGLRAGPKGFRLSQLFNWYRADFQGSAGGVGKFLAKYHRQHRAALEAASSFEYQPYDWSLNRR